MKNNKKTLLLNIVIVNWNTGIYLKKCIESILKFEKRDDILITIVDNNSSDNSLKITNYSDERIRIIKLKKNYGFAKACNIGANNIKSKYILFLNPDTKLLNNCISKSLDYMENMKDKKISILGIKNVTKDGHTKKTCCYFPNFLRMLCFIFGLNNIYPSYTSNFMINFSHQQNKIVDQVIGSYFLIKSESFLKLKGFDERFFVYFEELDLSYRAFLKGEKSFFLSDEKIFHLGGGSSSKVKAKRTYYYLRSKVLYINKHFPYTKSIILINLVLFIEPINRLIKSLFSFKFYNIIEIINAYLHFYKWFLVKEKFYDKKL